MDPMVLFFLIQLNILPQNVALDPYAVVAPLGRVTSMAASSMQVYALSGDNLLFIDKNSLRLETALYLEGSPQLIGYDNYTSDLWIMYRDKFVRLMVMTLSPREFPIPFLVDRFAVGATMLYLENTAGGRFTMDKVTGTITPAGAFPADLLWHRRLIEDDVTKYPFLSPYYYFDDVLASQTPSVQHPITAVLDDGLQLFIGTDRYGILKYNKVSWQSDRLVYGPLDLDLRRCHVIEDDVVFVSRQGLSILDPETERWTYQRLRSTLVDIAEFDGRIHIVRPNGVLALEGPLESPRGSFDETVLSTASDAENIYVGTRSGAFRIAGGTSSPVSFGPDRHAVYVIYPTSDAVYVGGEFGMYSYDRAAQAWSTLLSFGVKDIVALAGAVYALGTNDQLIRHPGVPPDTTLPADTNWTLLPYFNVRDIDTDGAALYCATHAGVYYFEPLSGSYNAVYNLPRLSYERVFVARGRLLAKTQDQIFWLPLEYRD